MTIKNLVFCCCLSTAALTVNAQAAIIDFETLSHADNLTADHGATYMEDGFLFTNIAPEEENSPTPSLATFGTEAWGYSGSTALFNDNWEGTTVLTKVDGTAFSLNSIDLSELYPSENPFEVTFTGWLKDGFSVTQRFTLDGLAGRERFYFDYYDFSEVLSVCWSQGGDDFHQFDNVNVPEPATMLLFGAGLIALLWSGKKKPVKPANLQWV